MIVIQYIVCVNIVIFIIIIVIQYNISPRSPILVMEAGFTIILMKEP